MSGHTQLLTITHPCVTGFNLRIYSDGGCVPSDLICGYILNYNGNETLAHHDDSPVFEYQTTEGDVCCELAPGLYWFSAQAADHAFPPQWGRLAADFVQACDTVFRSAYFAYPDWVPAIDVFGQPFDASQEISCGNCGAIPVENVSWGRIKVLYR